MILKKLKLTNFRNHLEFEEEFNSLKTIIIGHNAQGKTNILEAINLLSTTRSERAERDVDLVFWEKEYALIFADIETHENNINIALQINPSGRRKLKINGVVKKAPQADLLGNFFSVMFSCEDLFLIKGSPSVRRNWMDSILFQMDPPYHKQLQGYQKSITQKNSLLKKAQELGMPKSKLRDELFIWNEQIISLGSEILEKRFHFINDMNSIAKKFQLEISQNTENLNLIYKSFIEEEILEIPSLENLKSMFKAALESSFDSEYIRGQCLIGPHRDDLLLFINGKEAKLFCSQGQQRSIVISLKLAELEVISRRKNEIPVLLLDDVFAELDEKRQNFLLHNLPEKIQTFLTTTHISDLQNELLQNAKVLEIENGKIVRNLI